MEPLETDSIVNVHRRDGSSTGGRVYLGLDAGGRGGPTMPQIILRSIEGDDKYGVPVDEVEWVDVLGTPAPSRRRARSAAPTPGGLWLRGDRQKDGGRIGVRMSEELFEWLREDGQETAARLFMGSALRGATIPMTCLATEWISFATVDGVADVDVLDAKSRLHLEHEWLIGAGVRDSDYYGAICVPPWLCDLEPVGPESTVDFTRP